MSITLKHGPTRHARAGRRDLITNLSRPITAARAMPNQRTADTWPAALSRAPEWPRLTRNEVRRIVLDILG